MQMVRSWRAKAIIVVATAALVSAVIVVTPLALNALTNTGGVIPRDSKPTSEESGAVVNFDSNLPTESPPVESEPPAAPPAESGGATGNEAWKGQQASSNECMKIFNQISGELMSASDASLRANQIYNEFIQQHPDYWSDPVLAAEAQRLGDATLAATAAADAVRAKYPYQSFGCSGGVFVTTPW